MKENIIPNGTVVLLKEGTKRLMVVGWYPVSEDGTKYDYMGIFYPEGFIDLENVFLFNYDDIDKIDFLGFVDSEFQLFAKEVVDGLSKIADNESEEIKAEIAEDAEENNENTEEDLF